MLAAAAAVCGVWGGGTEARCESLPRDEGERAGGEGWREGCMEEERGDGRRRLESLPRTARRFVHIEHCGCVRDTGRQAADTSTS